jgi:hypothetical protein
MRLYDSPIPAFIDHFPRLAPGHGAAPRPRRKGRKKCAEGTCQLNSPRAKGSEHEAGRSANAAHWLASVAYTGPSTGIAPHKEREPRPERALFPTTGCADSCAGDEGRRHSVCHLAPPLKASIGDRMVEVVQHVNMDTAQGQRRMARILGVEVVWKAA